MKTYSLTALLCAITKNTNAKPVLLVTLYGTFASTIVRRELSVLTDEALDALCHEGTVLMKCIDLEEAKHTMEQIKKTVSIKGFLNVQVFLSDRGEIIDKYYAYNRY